MGISIDANRAKNSAIGVLFFYFVAHAYSALNLFPGWDSVNHIFYYGEIEEAQIGRYLRFIVPVFRGNVMTPWMISLISVGLLLATTYLVTEMLEFERPICIVLSGGILSTNFCITSIKALYIWIEDALMLSLFLAVLGIYLVWKKISYCYILSSLSFFVSFGLYQAFSSTIAVIILIIILKNVYQNPIVTKEKIRRLFDYIIPGAIGVVLYFIGLKALSLSELGAATGRGNTMDAALGHGVYDYIDQLYDNLTELIRLFFIPYNSHTGGWTYPNMLQIGGILLLVVGIISYIIQIRCFSRKDRFVATCLIVVLIASIASASIIINVCSWIKYLSYRLVYAIFLIYLVFIGIISEWQFKRKEKTSFGIMIVAFSFVLFWNIRMSNDVYIYQQIAYERAVIAVSKMMDDIEDDYDGDNQIVLVGNMALNDKYADYSKDYIEYFIELTNTSLGYQQLVSSMAGTLGPGQSFISDDSLDGKYSQMQEVMEMPIYPQKGYHKLIDGNIIVKLSE